MVTFAVRSLTDRATSLIASLGNAYPDVQFGLTVTTSQNGDKEDLSEIIGDADIVVTVTSSTEPLFPSQHVSAGTRLILVGSYKPTMQEVDLALVKRAGLIVVDSKEACGHEAGDLLQAGVKEEDMVELGSIIADEAARAAVGRGGDVCMFKSASRLWLRTYSFADLTRSGSGSRTLLSPRSCLTLLLPRGWEWKYQIMTADRRQALKQA
jgi:ornithine cyclodeaminase/alanine dehydrogenase-like protein (mu-crystallin family)